MEHGAWDLFDVEGGVSVSHQLGVLVLCSEPLDANALEPPVGEGFTHLLELKARDKFFREVVVRILVGLHARVAQAFRASADDLVRDLLVLGRHLL